MSVNNKDLSELFKTIRQFIKCYAGQGDTVAARQAVNAITPAAEQGDVKAQILLGRYYSWGYHSDCDDLKATYWFEKAADNGCADGVPEELLDCISDEDEERSLLQAIRQYKEIAGSDCDPFFKSEAYYKMGIAYHDLCEEKKAFMCFKKAAKLNCHEAYAKTGDVYRYGNGIEPNEAQARKWYMKGADVGEITATLNLAECDKNGIGGKQEYSKAMDYYLVLAESVNGRGFKHQAAGIGTALFEIGNMYLNGLGVQPDLKEAIRYFTLAVKKCNNPLAAEKLNEIL